MKTYLCFIFVLFFIQTASYAQLRDTVFLFSTADSIIKDTSEYRLVSEEILKRSISLSNHCKVNINIELSANSKSWKPFIIKASEEKLFVISSLKKIYILIDPERNKKTIHIIYKGDKYEIRWSSMEENFMLIQR